MQVIKEERCIEMAMYMLDHNATIAETAEHFKRATSTVYANVTRHLYTIDVILAKKVEKVLADNKQQRYKRGGEAFAMKMREQNQKQNQKQKH